MHVQGSVNPVGHFITLIKYLTYVEHFDSYGFTIDQELHITHERKYLTDILSDVPVIENTFPFQSKKEDTETCGRWCAVRCLLKHLNLQEFREFFCKTKNKYGGRDIADIF